ncbi:MAG TPA: hypothetical protein VJY36_01205 [Candidatus Bathyarchaeia archaeon]|nr:hypothetical protein [Candidatus Bathyarchaeia archaeon]
MGKMRTILTALIVAMLFVSAIVGTVIYYNTALNSKNSKITLLQSQISNQEKEIANLTSQIAVQPDLSKPHVITELGVTELETDWGPSWRLFIQGSAYNMGNSTAYNAGLKVEAYSGTGVLDINMTVPFVNGYNYGTDSSITSKLSQLGPAQLGNLTSGQAVMIDLDIYHEGVVTNWNVTPVWTNSP